MRVLILGGTRFMGPFVVRQLQAQGHTVAVFHRGQTHSDALPPDTEHFIGDRRDLAASTETLRGFLPDVVLDMICFTRNEAQMLLDVFRGTSLRRLVVASSVDVYRARDRFVRADPGPPDPTPLTENSPVRDRLFPYAKEPIIGDTTGTTYEKILVERTLQHDTNLPTTLLRLPMVYGPGDFQHRFFEYIKRMDDGRPAILLPGDIATWRAPRGYVEDMAAALVLCATREEAAGRLYHVGEQPSVTEQEMVARLAETVRWQGKIVVLPNADLPTSLQHTYDAAQDWSIDSTKIRRELGYTEITPPDVALSRTVEYERANPPQPIDPAQFDYSAEDASLSKH